MDFRDETAYTQSVLKPVWGITNEKPAQIIDLRAPDLPFTVSIQSGRQTEAMTVNTTTSSTPSKESPRTEFFGEVYETQLLLS